MHPIDIQTATEVVVTTMMFLQCIYTDSVVLVQRSEFYFGCSF